MMKSVPIVALILALGVVFGFLPGERPQPIFKEAGKEWGLTKMVIYGGEESEKTLLESTGTGVAVIDFDKDGRPDLFVVNGSRLEDFKADAPPVSMLYRNAGDHFEDVTEKSGLGRAGWGQGVCVGDYDNDGWPDLYVTYYGYNVLYHNQGDGTFEERGRQAGVAGEKPRWGAGCAFVDYDRDGKLDLMVANYVAYEDLAAYQRRTRCNWRGMPVVCGPLGLPRDTNLLYHNNGDGAFTDVSRPSGITQTAGHYCFQPITADFDGDGWSDIFVTCDSTSNILYRNNKNGTYTDVGLISGTAVNGDGNPQASMGVAVGDFDRDGRPDIFVTTFAEDTPTLYKNEGGWIFADVTLKSYLGRHRQYLGWGTLFFDFDNDGWEDLFLANGHVYREVQKYRLGSYRQGKLLYRNQADGTFSDISAQAGPEISRKTAARGLAAEDFNGDGSLDIVIVNLNEPPSLLLNQNHEGNWLLISLEGKTSNKSAIGARVTIEAAGRKQTREVRSASSYYSSSGFRLHFGLGKTPKVDVLQVSWPSGKVSRFENLTANRALAIREGDTVPLPRP
jgi:hypothetical protein